MKYIKISQDKLAIVDDSDFFELSKYKWHILNTGGRLYAIRYVKMVEKVQKTIGMHRQIMNAPKGLVVDHINGNSLDNRRCNLRICTIAENSRNNKISKNNTTGYKGVYKCNNKYYSQINENGKRKHLGVFHSKKAAAVAYNNAAKRVHGEFASLNSI